jgi:hypothetical protein
MPGRNTWSASDHDQGRNEPGDHLEASSISQERASTRRPPGSIRPRPGTERARAQPGDIEHKPGQATRGRSSTHDQADRCQGATPGAHQTTTRDGTSQATTWKHRASDQGRASQGDHLERISHKPGTSEHQGHTWSASDHDQERNEHQGDRLETSDHDQGRNEPGAHLETSAISQGRSEPGRPPGDIEHKPGTSEPGRNTWSASAISQGQNEHQGAQLNTRPGGQMPGAQHKNRLLNSR